ncbi:hypothetical protein EHS13_28905 [Paenibacillus psychroresistens]|uniref:Uncharacterized protein n=1 Tax=Paenibacillus psychroresistens TaxID=1778678 RepID=A0A6B8RTH2_9BACL|nr:hypothetical protein [Paenibacillus psychroresistens]QGQ98616.1 hypothetical protein EHS13_28905 [Paenibacillus psychroresistens]
MDKVPVYLQFAHEKTALQAFDTLQELEYNVELLEHEHVEHIPTLVLYVNNTDLTSALEIAQAHGGWIVEGKRSIPELEILTSAYELDYVPIPAHVVNDEEIGDPSEGDYDHFPAGVRL